MRVGFATIVVHGEKCDSHRCVHKILPRTQYADKSIGHVRSRAIKCRVMQLQIVHITRRLIHTDVDLINLVRVYITLNVDCLLQRAGAAPKFSSKYVEL